MHCYISDIFIMKAYSIDLRKRVLSICDEGKHTISHIAREFKVSRSWIHNLKKQRQLEGSISPRGHGGGRQPAFVGNMLKELDELVESRCDITLVEIKEHFSSRIDCSLQAIANNLKRLGWGYKKNHYVRLSKIEKM